jgi:hypothetical protein
MSFWTPFAIPCEKAVDLTAMLLDFRLVVNSACYKEKRSGNLTEVHRLGYLTRSEVQLANRLLEQDEQNPKAGKPKTETWKPSRTKTQTRQVLHKIASRKVIAACVAAVLVIGLASIDPGRRIWRLHQQLLTDQAAIERNNLPRWLSTAIVLVGVRVGLTSLTTVHRVVLSPGEQIE